MDAWTLLCSCFWGLAQAFWAVATGLFDICIQNPALFILAAISILAGIGKAVAKRISAKI